MANLHKKEGPETVSASSPHANFKQPKKELFDVSVIG
jgi:hypothetical protein